MMITLILTFCSLCDLSFRDFVDCKGRGSSALRIHFQKLVWPTKKVICVPCSDSQWTDRDFDHLLCLV